MNDTQVKVEVELPQGAYEWWVVWKDVDGPYVAEGVKDAFTAIRRKDRIGVEKPNRTVWISCTIEMYKSEISLKLLELIDPEDSLEKFVAEHRDV